jgi:hypothetical protein
MSYALYRPGFEAPVGHLISTAYIDMNTSEETYSDENGMTTIRYRHYSDSQGMPQRVEINRSVSISRSVRPIHVLGQMEPTDYVDTVSTGLRWERDEDGPYATINGERLHLSDMSLTDTTASNAILGLGVATPDSDFVAPTYATSIDGIWKTEDPAIEELRDEIQFLKDEIAQLKMLLLEN